MILFWNFKFRFSNSKAARKLSFASILCASALFPTVQGSAALAQYPGSKLIGVVSAQDRQKRSGVSVRLIGEGSPPVVYKTETDGTGEFKFVDVPPGRYRLEVSFPGEPEFRLAHLELRPASTQELSISLAGKSAASGNGGLAPRGLDRGVEWGSDFGSLALSKLPNARNVWSLLESQEPSTVTNRLDVGGLETGVPALFGALGASWTENQYALNGFDVTDPYISGRPLMDPDLDAVQEFRVVTGAKPGWLTGSGSALAFQTAPAWEDSHGAARAFFSGRGTQSDNMDARLRRLQFPGPERMDHLVDGSAQWGGRIPLAGASFPVLASVSTQQLAKDLGGFAAPIDVHVYRALTEITPLSRDNQQLNLLYAGQHIFNSREGEDPRVAPSATTLGNDNYYQFQARWNRNLSPSATLALGFGAVHAVLSSGIQNGLQETSRLDLPLLLQSGPAPLATAGGRSRYQAKALYEALPRHWAGSHSLDVGFDWDRSYVTNRWDSLGGLEEITVAGAGEEVRRWNTPTAARQHVQNADWFAQDAWRPFHWLRLPVSLRMETSSGQAAGVANHVRWTTFEPRAGLVLPLSRRGPILRASWSRYGHLLQGRYFDSGNPAALGEQTFLWRDLNGDGQVQPQEIGPLLRVSGGPYSAVDRGLARPFTDEVSAGIEQNFSAGFLAGVRFFRRDDHRLIALLNLGVLASDYQPVQVLDPGNDGIPGTADDQVLTLYNENVSALGKDFFLLTNPPGDRASFEGFELRLSKPLIRRWEFSASFTASRTLAPTSPGNSVYENDTGFFGALYTDPNTLLFDTSRTYFDRAFVGKATGYYLAPGGFQIGAVAKYYDGLPFGRLLFVNGFNQGPFFVRATPRGHPGGFQTQFNGTLDVRVAREFALSKGILAGYLDCFNILNMNRNTLESDLTGPAFQSRVPLAIESPRLARLGIEWKF